MLTDPENNNWVTIPVNNDCSIQYQRQPITWTTTITETKPMKIKLTQDELIELQEAADRCPTVARVLAIVEERIGFEVKLFQRWDDEEEND